MSHCHTTIANANLLGTSPTILLIWAATDADVSIKFWSDSIRSYPCTHPQWLWNLCLLNNNIETVLLYIIVWHYQILVCRNTVNNKMLQTLLIIETHLWGIVYTGMPGSKLSALASSFEAVVIFKYTSSWHTCHITVVEAWQSGVSTSSALYTVTHTAV